MSDSLRKVNMSRNDDLRYISNPMLWVQMVCPLRQRRADNLGYNVAYMIGDGPNLYHGNMWNPSRDDKKESFIKYADILDAGWEID